MRGEVTLVRLRETAEAGHERDGDGAEVEVQVVEGGQQVHAVQSRRDAVLKVVVLARVRVGQVAHVADEGSFVQDVLDARPLRGVVTRAWPREDGRVTGFDGGADARLCGVGGNDGGDEVCKLGVGLYKGVHEHLGFVFDVGEDQGGGDAAVVACLKTCHFWGTCTGGWGMGLPEANSREGS